MARRKLRAIVVDGRRYLWRLGHRYVRDAAGQGSARYTFVAYLDGHRTGRLEIAFATWEDPIAGGPLHTGAPLDPLDPDSAINLNHPGHVAPLIRAAVAAGWDPTARRAPFLIADGLPLLRPAPDV